MNQALRCLGVFAVAALCAFSSCSKKAGAPAVFKDSENADVIVVVVDALRADRMTPRFMPGINSLMDEYGGLIFTSAVAQASWTAPSMASIFTGLHPVSHRVLTPEDMAERGLSLHVLSGGFRTLSEAFSEAGYKTAAYAPNEWISSRLGFAQGFDSFADLPFKETTENVAGLARDWIRALDANDRYFLYLHLMDVHGPYDAPAEYAAKFAGAYPDRLLTEEEFGRLDYLAKGAFDDPAARNLSTYQTAYDAGVAYTDEKLTAFLKDVFGGENGKKKPIVIIMADHGEAFYEHGYPDHGHTLYDEEIIVPLIIMAPGEISGRVVTDHIVELVDIYPTLVEMTGIAPPSYKLSGVSLSCALEDGADCENRVAESSTYFRGPRRVAVRTADFKAIHVLGAPEATRIFDLENDPAEMNDLSPNAKLMDKAVELLNERFEINKSAGPDPKTITDEKSTFNEKQLKSLKSLGYVK